MEELLVAAPDVDRHRQPVALRGVDERGAELPRGRVGEAPRTAARPLGRGAPSRSGSATVPTLSGRQRDHGDGARCDLGEAGVSHARGEVLAGAGRGEAPAAGARTRPGQPARPSPRSRPVSAAMTAAWAIWASVFPELIGAPGLRRYVTAARPRRRRLRRGAEVGAHGLEPLEQRPALGRRRGGARRRRRRPARAAPRAPAPTGRACARAGRPSRGAGARPRRRRVRRGRDARDRRGPGERAGGREVLDRAAPDHEVHAQRVVAHRTIGAVRRAGELREVGGRELELEAAAAGAHEDRLVLERASSSSVRMRLRWPSGLMPPTTYPVARCASLGSAIAARLPSARRSRLAGHRQHAHAQLAVDGGQQRLEHAGRLEPEPLGRLEPVRRARLVVVVLVHGERDPGLAGGRGGGCLAAGHD